MKSNEINGAAAPLNSLPNVRCGGTAAQNSDSKEEADRRLPRMTCSASSCLRDEVFRVSVSDLPSGKATGNPARWAPASDVDPLDVP